MALVVKDRVRETSTTTGTGTITLAGAVTGYQSFSAIGNGNTTYYTIYLQGGSEWEVGIGTYTASGTTLSRDTILASSNGGAAVNFSAGTKDVFVTYPAGRSVYYDTATNVTLNALTLSGGTANGVLYLNGSKVATSGSALTFDGNYFTVASGTGAFFADIMQVSGTATKVNANGVGLEFRGGATPNITSYSRVGSVYLPVTLDALTSTFSISGSERMRLNSTSLNIGGNFTSTNNTLQVTGNVAIGDTLAGPTDGLYVKGNVGIGTNSPAAKLEIVQTASGVSGWFVGGQFSAANYPLIRLAATTLNKYASIGNNADGGFTFVVNGTSGAVGTEAMYLNASGNLGLGVTPSAWGGLFTPAFENRGGAIVPYSTTEMLVTQNAYFNGTNWIYKVTSTASLYAQASGVHKWFNAVSGTADGTAATSLTSAQNGNSYTIKVAGTTDFTLLGAANNNVGTVFTKSGGTGTGTGTVSQNISLTQAMTLDASGNLLVGATSGSSGITLERSGAASAEIKLNQTGASGRDYRIASTGSGYGSAGNLIFYDATAPAERARITSGGNFYVGNTVDTGVGSFIYPAGLVRLNTAGTVFAQLRYSGSSVGTVDTDGVNIQYNAQSALVFGTNGTTERVRIDSAGTVFMRDGTSTTNTNSSRLVVGGTISETVSSTQYLVASQYDIGTAPNDIPLNQYLGSLAYQDASSIAGQVGLSAGTAALPSLVSATDTDTGMWFPAANTLAWSTGGTERARITSGGNLIVGDTSGTVRVTSSAGGADGATSYAGAFHANKGTTGDAWVQLGGVRSDSLGSGRVAYIDARGASVVGTLGLSVDGAEKARITSGGYFKASDNGTYNSGASNYHEFNQSAALNALEIYAGNATYTANVVVALAARNTTNNSFYYFGAYNTGAAAFKFRVADSGAIATAGGIALGTATPATSGIGVQFPATQSASSNANTLDDYEEGNWTPGISFGTGTTGITYGAQSGSYIKIGSVVTAIFNITLTNKGSSTGDARVTGLPFTTTSGARGGGSITYANAMGTISNCAGLLALVEAGQTYFNLRYFNSSTFNSTTLTEGSFANTSDFWGIVTYTV